MYQEFLGTFTKQKNEISIKDFIKQMWPNLPETTDLVSFTEEIL